MLRIEVVAAAVIVATTGVAWSMSLAQDREPLAAESRAAGQVWAQSEKADPSACREEAIRLLAPVDPSAWRAGCLDQVAVDAAAPAPGSGGSMVPISVALPTTRSTSTTTDGHA